MRFGNRRKRMIPLKTRASVSDPLWRSISDRERFILIAGPCVIESESLCFEVGRELRKLCQKHRIILIFKASFDKANRTSASSCRGPGLRRGLEILGKIRDDLGIPVLTDIHETHQAQEVGDVVDVVQIPAFLCRQTDLITAAVRTGKIVNLKKGQFLAPQDMAPVVRKAVEAGGRKLILTERGTTFGYNNLVADMRSLPILRELGFPVVFDATHSVQLPGAGGTCSSGQREFAPVLARSAIAAGAQGLFIETHPQPDQALSDGPNMIPLKEMPRVLFDCLKIQSALRSHAR